MTNRLLITGGTGFFGAALLERLNDKNIRDRYDINEVTVLSRSPTTFYAKRPRYIDADWLKLIKGDILSTQWWDGCLATSHVIHAAADSANTQHLSPLQQYEQIVSGTRNLLRFAARQKIDKFLLTSSGAVYARQPSEFGNFKESHLGAPLSNDLNQIYGIAKRAAETECEIFSHEFNFGLVVARCFAFVGHDLPLNSHFAIGNFINDALQDKNITVAGDGSPVRAYMHQSQLSSVLLELIFGDLTGTYNVGSDERITIQELARKIALLSGKSLGVDILGTNTLRGAEKRNIYVPNINKLKLDLDFTPMALDDAIFSTLKALQCPQNLH